MKRVNLSIALFAVIALIYTSCGKYEEGPSFSLRTKTTRLTGEWKLVELSENGKVQELEDNLLLYEFIDGGEFKLTMNFMGIDFSFSGEWKFDDSKEKLEVRVKEDNVWGEWESYDILRLTNTELWFKDVYTDDGESFEDIYKFEKQ